MVAPHDGMDMRFIREALSGKRMDGRHERCDVVHADNQVWDLVDLPAECQATGNKWVRKIKRKTNGSIERYKACLIAKAYTQQEGAECDETFFLLVRFA